MTVRLYNPQRPPDVWRWWLTSLGASPRVCQQLWRVLLVHGTGDEIGTIVRAQRRRDRPAVVAMLATFSPQRLFTMCAILAPEGRERASDVRMLEQGILHHTKHPDVWR